MEFQSKEVQQVVGCDDQKAVIFIRQNDNRIRLMYRLDKSCNRC